MKDAAEVISWIKSLRPLGIKPGNERMEYMLERLGNPERRLKFIHIAGTNGKGSTATYLSSVLRTCQYDVGLYTSPHITTYLSRIMYNGEEIGEEPLIEIGNKLRLLADELAENPLGKPTEFEILTLTAILYFAQYTYPDVVVWETGMGGMWDSTNVVHPILTIITNVAMDHMHMLGDSIENIAADKAGIIKSGVPLITAVEDEAAFSVIEEKAREKQAKTYLLGRDFSFTETVRKDHGQSFSFIGPFRGYEGVTTRLRGVHQYKNAALSLMALEVLRQYYAFIIEEEDLYKGFKEAFIPGRLEIVKEEPLLLIDGAHNPHGAKALALSVKETYGDKSAILVLSILQDKLIEEMLAELLPIADQVVLTKASNPRAIDPAVLFEKIKSIQPNLPIYIEEEPIHAVKKALSLASKEDLVLVTGSLYLLAQVRDRLSDVYETKVGDS